MIKKYEYIANEIKSEIENDLTIEKLPTEGELINKYGTSRDTVRAAFQKLKDEEIIYSKRGSGYFVKHTVPQIKNLLNEDFSITEMVENAGVEIGKRDETIDVIETDEYEKYFGACHAFFVVERTRTAQKKPIAFSRIFLPVETVGRDFPLKYRSGPLKTFLKEKLSLVTAEAYTRIEAYEPEKDNIPEIFRELPMIKLTQDNRNQRGKTILVTEDFIRSDAIELYVHRIPGEKSY